MPNYPNVPKLPGVPPLLRDPSTINIPGGLPNLLAMDSPDLAISNPKAPVWGLFQNGKPVITADNVIAVEYKQSYAIADYPVEKGAFESYDKVNNPFRATVRFSAGGPEQNRKQFLDKVAEIAKSLELYDLQTPEVSYASVNVESFDYRRTADNGAGLIIIDINVVQVRTTAEASFTNTQSPSGADTTDDGTVQTEDPTELERSLTTIRRI